MNSNTQNKLFTSEQGIGKLQIGFIFVAVAIVILSMEKSFSSTGNQATSPGYQNPLFLDSKAKIIDECKGKGSSLTDPKVLECIQNLEAAVSGKNKCEEAKSERGKKLGSAQADCRRAGVSFKQCLERAKECSEFEEEEVSMTDMLSQAVGQFFPSASGLTSAMGALGSGVTARDVYRGQCMKTTDYKSEKKELQDSMKDLGRDIKELEKEMADTKKDAEKDKKEVSNKLTEIYRDQTKRQKEIKEGIRKSQQELLTQQIETKMKIRELQTSIIKMQGNLSRTLIQRGAALRELSDALVSGQCRRELNKYIKENYPSTGLVGGAYLANYTQQKKQDIQMRWQNCLVKAQELRDQQRSEYAEKVRTIEEEINSTEENIRNLESGLQTAGNDSAQAKKESDEAEQKMQEADRQEAVALSNEALAIDTRTKELIASRTQALTKAKSDLAKASNDLGSLGGRPAGEKSPGEAIQTVYEFIEADKNAVRACGGRTPDMPEIKGITDAESAKGTDD